MVRNCEWNLLVCGVLSWSNSWHSTLKRNKTDKSIFFYHHVCGLSHFEKNIRYKKSFNVAPSSDDILRYCDFIVILLTMSLHSPLTIHLNILWCCIWYHCDPWPSKHRGRHHTFLVIMFGSGYNTKYIMQLWQKARKVFAMAPFLKMSRVANCPCVPSFMLLWKSEQNFHTSPGPYLL